MIKRRSAVFAAIATAAALTLAACGSSADSGSGDEPTTNNSQPGDNGGDSDGDSDGDSGTVDGEGRTLTVWYMNGDYTPETIDAIKAEFESKTGASATVELQEWDGITTKVSTALATNTPPDVIDLGNTQVASYAANGGLMDLTEHKEDLQQGQTWLAGLEDPATIDGKLYAVPGFAGDRAVIYNKKLWAEAGIDGVPTTWDEFTDALDKLMAANTDPDFSAIYIPGQYWYAGLQFVWDAGGDIATFADGEWASGFSTPEAQQGLEDFKAFQNKYVAPSSQTLDTDDPPQQQVFADGKTAALLATNVYLKRIQDVNPDITDDDLGTFPMPGKSGNQPVMLGGSDWGIAAKSQNQDLALEWVKIATSPEIQEKWVFGNDHWIPNSTEAAEKATETVEELQKAFFTAALNSKATPASPHWAELEGAKEINNLFASIASGSQSVADAAAAFDDKANAILNGAN